MKIREHRGSLPDSMATVRQVKDRAELVEVIRETLRPFAVDIPPEHVHVEPYTYDPRIDWDTHIITVDGYGVWGMSDGPL